MSSSSSTSDSMDPYSSEQSAVIFIPPTHSNHHHSHNHLPHIHRPPSFHHNSLYPSQPHPQPQPYKNLNLDLIHNSTFSNHHNFTPNNNLNATNFLLTASSVMTTMNPNITSTTENMTNINPYTVPTGLICLLAFLYGSISLLAVIGNCLVILVIVRNRLMHTVTNIFIANLAVADVIIGIFSIPFQFQAALLQRWVLANFMCPLAPFVQVVSVNVSIFTLSVIAVDRYIAVIHPFHAGCSKKSASIVITVIWTIAVTTALPFPLFYWVKYVREGSLVLEQCLPNTPDGMEELPFYIQAVLVSIQYPIPLVVITYCYCRIAWHIWGSRRPGAQVSSEDIRGRNKRKVVKMMIIVVCLFVLCWLPLQLYNLLSTINSSINEYKYINIIWFSSNWLAMSNSCYNPFIYGLLNEKFKREFRHLFEMCPCRKKTQNDYYTEYFSEDVKASRRANNNHRGSGYPSGRQGAVRYNFYSRSRSDRRSCSYNKGHNHIQSDETETSQI